MSDGNRTFDIEESELQPQSGAAVMENGGRPPRSVLLVEDDAAFGETLQVFLESSSFSVSRAVDGADGLRQIKTSDFDIILCDMVMPNLSGDQFYQEVERVKPHLCAQFLFMTGHRADPRSERIIRQMGRLMLWKPFLMADLLKAIEIVWSKSRRQTSRPTRR